MRNKLPLLVALAVLAVSWLLPGGAFAQAEPCAQDAGPAGCVDVSLLPASLSGDVYLDGALIAAQVKTVRLSVTPGQPHLIEVKNVADTTPGFGDLFRYGDASQANVTVSAGRVRAVTLRPRIEYLKGFLNLTCDIRGRDAAQAVACQPSVDGAPLSPVEPGQTARFALANGPHTVRVDLAGGDAGLWGPAFLENPVTIAGNQNAYLRATFNRKGRLTVNFNVPGVAGDVYVDGALVASQVTTTTLYVDPGNHTVEGKNLTDPAANGVYRYADVSTRSYVGPNQARAATLRPRKEFLLGFGQITCRLNRFAGQDARCAVAVDGVPLGTIEAGQKATYNLAPGPHALEVSLTGSAAPLWAPPAVANTLTIAAGRTTWFTATFNPAPATPTAPAPPAGAQPQTGTLMVVMCQDLEATMTIFRYGQIVRQESLHSKGANLYELPVGHYDLQFEARGYYNLNVAADIEPGGVFTWYIGEGC